MAVEAVIGIVACVGTLAGYALYELYKRGD